ncbi:hypothetical protein C8Q76DRAFT_799166 [Earliella scabrosa]|nr:hypothetical protein C8Q76DRAFT_799166 [Earliella scabrosa]
MAVSSPSLESSSTLFLVPGQDDSSRAPLLVSSGETSPVAEDSLFFEASAVAQSTPVIPSSTPVPSSSSANPCPGSARPLFFQMNVHPPSPPRPVRPKRDVEGELRDIVDDLLRKKKDAQRTLAEENASLLAQVSFLKQALARASTTPGSETADVLDALDRERTLRQNAEESRAATGKYLAEQVESVSKQKAVLEQELQNFTHGREFWKTKAIAALERCEVLEAENLKVKTQLSVLARKQTGVVAQQVDSVLREVAEERDRLRQLEEVEAVVERQGKPPVKTSEAEAMTRRVASKFQTYRVTVR